MDHRFVYVTTANREEARAIGQVLVEERLVACVNIIDGMSSIYRWQGEVQEDSETVLIAKTGAARMPRLVARIKALHSYEVPCVVAVPITEGNPDYLAWVQDETRT
jgi:periplasmic divalent cation tolerance protein